VTYFGDEMIVLSDESEKILDVGIGHVTGSGYVPLLDSVKCAMRKATIDHTDQILQIINNERAALRNEAIDKEAADEYIRITGWLFTYRTFAEGRQRLRVRITHPSFGDDTGFLEVSNAAKLIGPKDCDPRDVARISAWLNANLKLTCDIPDYLESVKYHVPYLAACFSDIADHCKSVSEAFDVAIMRADGARAILDAICPSR